MKCTVKKAGVEPGAAAAKKGKKVEFSFDSLRPKSQGSDLSKNVDVKLNHGQEQHLAGPGNVTQEQSH